MVVLEATQYLSVEKIPQDNVLVDNWWKYGMPEKLLEKIVDTKCLVYLGIHWLASLVYKTEMSTDLIR